MSQLFLAMNKYWIYFRLLEGQFVTEGERMPETEKAQILIIEDELSLAQLEKRVLENFGYSVNIATTGAEGLEKLNRDDYELILLDFYLPDMTGKDILELLGQKIESIPVIMVTGQGDEQLAVEMMKMGLQDYLSKTDGRNFIHLLPKTVEGALQRFSLKNEKVILERKLREGEERFRRTFQSIPDAAYLWEMDDNDRIMLIQVNSTGKELAEGTGVDLTGLTPEEFFKDDPEIIKRIEEAFTAEPALREEREINIRFLSGVKWAVIDYVRYTPKGILLIIKDITQRNEFESKLKKMLDEQDVLIENRTRNLSEMNEKYKNELQEKLKVEKALERKSLALAEQVRKMTCLNNFSHMISVKGEAVDEILEETVRLIPTAFQSPDDICARLEFEGRRYETKECPETPYFSTDIHIENELKGKIGVFFLTEETAKQIEPSIASEQSFMQAISDLVGRALSKINAGKRELSLEVKLRQAQKMQAVGSLASGIAHEINTPIQFIGDNIRFLQDSFSDLSSILTKLTNLKSTESVEVKAGSLVAELSKDVREIDIDFIQDEVPLALEQSLEGINRVASIVKAMREFAHPGSDEPMAVDINKAIKSTITVARNEWKYFADMETDFDPDLPLISCVPGEINQAMLNIIVNAAQAIGQRPDKKDEEKGTISISTRHDGNWAEIRISDTGIGISDEVKPRIFEPFFTTKDVGKGTGQGLAIVYSVIVEKHHGELFMESEMGSGTTFILRLPLKEQRESILTGIE